MNQKRSLLIEMENTVSIFKRWDSQCWLDRCMPGFFHKIYLEIVDVFLFFFSYFSKHVIRLEKSRFVFLIKHCQILCLMMTTITKICCDQLLKTSLTIMHLGILLTLNMFNWMTRGILCSSNIGPLLLPQSNILAKQWPINVYRGKGGVGWGFTVIKNCCLWTNCNQRRNS